MKTAHFEVMQAEALNKEIKAIAGIGNKLNKRIQFAALNAITIALHMVMLALVSALLWQ